MATDVQLSGNFWLREFPGWQRATPADVARIRETVQRVLQPVRNEFGRTSPTSWKWWSSGEPRTGAHAEGGTVDFVTLDAPLRAVYSWGVTHLLPGGYVGRWIYEPPRFGDDGRKLQGEHIHVAPRADMLAAFGKDDVGAFVETAEGVYEPEGGPFGGASGAYGDPIELPGLVVTVPFNYMRWAALGALAGVLYSWGKEEAPRA